MRSHPTSFISRLAPQTASNIPCGITLPFLTHLLGTRSPRSSRTYVQSLPAGDGNFIFYVIVHSSSAAQYHQQYNTSAACATVRRAIRYGPSCPYRARQCPGLTFISMWYTACRSMEAVPARGQKPEATIRPLSHLPCIRPLRPKVRLFFIIELCPSCSCDPHEHAPLYCIGLRRCRSPKSSRFVG